MGFKSGDVIRIDGIEHEVRVLSWPTGETGPAYISYTDPVRGVTTETIVYAEQVRAELVPAGSGKHADKKAAEK